MNNNRDIAIEFSKTLRNKKYSIELEEKIVNDLFIMIRDTENVSDSKASYIKNTIIALVKFYEDLDFTSEYDVGMFSEDVIGNLAYLYGFDKYNY